MDGIERSITTWRRIALQLGVSERKAYLLRHELKEAGVIFYVRTRKGKTVHAFPSRIKNWLGLKGSKDEII